MKNNLKINKLNKTFNLSFTPPPQTFRVKITLFFLFASLIFSLFQCTRPTAPADNHCSTEDLIERLQKNPPALNDCSPLSIRGAGYDRPEKCGN